MCCHCTYGSNFKWSRISVCSRISVSGPWLTVSSKTGNYLEEYCAAQRSKEELSNHCLWNGGTQHPWGESLWKNSWVGFVGIAVGWLSSSSLPSSGFSVRHSAFCEREACCSSLGQQFTPLVRRRWALLIDRQAGTLRRRKEGRLTQSKAALRCTDFSVFLILSLSLWFTCLYDLYSIINFLSFLLFFCVTMAWVWKSVTGLTELVKLQRF